MKKLWVSYLLCLIFPGMHRIYLGKYFSGVLYIFTLGFFGIGTFIDLLLMPTLVQEANDLGRLYHMLQNTNQKNNNKTTTVLQRIPTCSQSPQRHHHTARGW